MFKDDELAERKKRQDELKRANVKLAQMELVTKQEMLKNHFGDRMLPTELQVMKHFRTGSSDKVPRKPCQLGRALTALSQARQGG